jgi:putative FmdB family regulatory protein
MPIFDYVCQGCGHTFDALQKADEGHLKKCPECGKLKLKRALSAPNFHLKGGGWYQTDFKGGKDGKGATAKAGHNLDSGKDHGHSHDSDSAGAHSHGGSPAADDKKKGTTHSHGGKTHSHGPGCGHSH